MLQCHQPVAPRAGCRGLRRRDLARGPEFAEPSVLNMYLFIHVVETIEVAATLLGEPLQDKDELRLYRADTVRGYGGPDPRGPRNRSG